MFKYFFRKPDQISSAILDQIYHLIKGGGGVGTAYIKENLNNAFLIAYAMDQDRVIGTVVLKHPKEEYRMKIEAETGLNLCGYLERGYTSVDPEYRNQAIADRLIKGLIERPKGQKIYVTINMENIPPLRLTYKNQMVLAGTFINRTSGHTVGVFINQEVIPS